MKKLLFFLTLLMLSACVQLSPAGAQIRILTEDQLALVATCKSLGAVSVSSEDALRNASAALAGDTAVMSRRSVGSTLIVHGDVYLCSAVSEKIQAPKKEVHDDSMPAATENTDAELLRRSNVCHAKGGDWISGQCVIDIK